MVWMIKDGMKDDKVRKMSNNNAETIWEMG
jgi:hypothetical protein